MKNKHFAMPESHKLDNAVNNLSIQRIICGK
jgi:hypothetical protein